MAILPGKTEAFWTVTAAPANLPAMSGDRRADVAIVGGGIAGLTAAMLLQQAGRRVVLIEALRIGGQATGRSTAKVTSQHHLIYSQLTKSYGEEAARIYGEANQAALARICDWSRELAIDCDLERKPAYVVALSPDHRDKMEREAEVARKLGLPASYTRDTSLPFEVAGAVRFGDQAQFHPSKYLIGLARRLAEAGGEVYENTRATKIESGEQGCRVETAAGAITATDVVVATHMPVIMEGRFFAKAHPYAHPMVAAPIDAARAPDGMFITADEPTLSLRTARRGDSLYLIAVGATYRTGDEDGAREAARGLIEQLRDRFGIAHIEYHWTDEDFMSVDGLPFVGRADEDDPHLLVATGFNAWGMTNGTAAGMILADAVLGRPNPWASLFDATRTNIKQGAVSFVTENVKVAKHLAAGHLKRDHSSTEEIAPGEATVVKQDGEQHAVYRDEGGQLHMVSAVCTHMGCVVGWNPIDRTWDCPCHGSRFAHDGTVINGPALSPLEAKSGE